MIHLHFITSCKVQGTDTRVVQILVYWDKLLEGETLKKWKDLAKDLIKAVAVNWSHKINQSSHFHPLNSAMYLPLHMQQSHTWLR